MTSLKIATYNIRTDTPEDGDWSWQTRKSHVKCLINYHNWDVFGVQEVLPHQLDDLKELRDYEFVGVARDDGKIEGEYNGLFFKKDRFILVDSHYFWLSDTPDEPSIHPTAGCKRICVCTTLKEKTSNKEITLAVTHLDHVSEEARVLGAEIIINRVKKHFNNPFILMGDFNAEPSEQTYKLLSTELTDAKYKPGAFVYGPKGTFQEFDYTCSWNNLVEIDYLFVSESVTVKRLGTLTDSTDCRFPSDHFPVVAHIDL